MELLKLLVQCLFVATVGGSFLCLIYFAEKILESAVNEEIQVLEEFYNIEKYKE